MFSACEGGQQNKVRRLREKAHYARDTGRACINVTLPALDNTHL
jgi:hypothetical protein